MTSDIYVLPDSPTGEDCAVDIAVSRMDAGYTVIMTREDYGSKRYSAPVIVVTCVSNKPSRKERGCYT